MRDTEAVQHTTRPQLTLVKGVLPTEVATAGPVTLIVTRKKDTEGVAGTKNLMRITRKKDTEGVAEKGAARKVTIEELSVAAATGAYALE
ncbi:hypothetical protein ACFX2A_014524 [Malus domestica]